MPQASQTLQGCARARARRGDAVAGREARWRQKITIIQFTFTLSLRVLSGALPTEATVTRAPEMRLQEAV